MIYLLSPLQKEGTHALPIITFELLVNSIDFSSCNMLMFTSKQAVIFVDKVDKKWKEIPCIAIGGATKKKIEELGGTVLYYPKKFYGEALSQDIKNYFNNKRILYLRPQEVSFDSKAYLEKEDIYLEEQIIYKTSCKSYLSEDQPRKNAIIIFTSPSTIRCFFKNFKWDKSYMAILIGNATKEHLPKECHYEVADVPLIESCLKKAKEIEKNRLI